MAEEARAKYGGDYIEVPLTVLLKKGRGDDVNVVVDHERQSTYGTLDIQKNETDYDGAKHLAMMRIPEDVGPMMIAVEDEESGSPMVLSRKLEYGGKTHYLAVIYNASFAHNPEETSNGSFCLRLSSRLDPDGKFSERICYTPGKNIDWLGEQEQFLRDMLMA